MIDRLIQIYKDYGFSCEKKYLKDGVLVFTLNNGYFNNAEIVSVGDTDHIINDVFDQYTASGYACTLRRNRSVSEVEMALFKGFFFVDSTKNRLRADYSKFTSSIASFYSSSAVYKYIDAPYLINERPAERPIVNEIIGRLRSDKPALLLIEAAAGFGKTCTAYEIINEILDREDSLPLFSELSRNRSAKIFRYVLLDEIDRTFPQLKSRLVEGEILKGRVVVVLDGFDELLRKSDKGEDFESAEPMLETIGELLQGRAKIILTTRRTVLFEGDEFHHWMDESVDKFDVVRFKLSEPRITDWLPPERRAVLESAGFEIEGIANPVLLSYLRCISDDEFEHAVEDKDQLVSRYFTYMLDRERTRQDLRLDVDGQYAVMAGVAKDMMDLGYTSESREYIVDLIKSTYVKTLDEVRSAYATSERPSRDEVANKLASHALLDKSLTDETKIGFINEFVFGNFVADNIIMDPGWLNDDLRFLEPAVISYIPRSKPVRERLRESLDAVMEFLDWSARIDFSLKLGRGVDFELTSGEAGSLSFECTIVGERSIENFQFNDCSFKECVFVHGSFKGVTFLNCKFYNCRVDERSGAGVVHVLGCTGDAEVISALAAQTDGDSRPEDDTETYRRSVDEYILEKFWPVGTASFHRRRPIKGICARNNDFTPEELYAGLDSLKKRGFIFEPAKPSFVEISMEKIGEVMKILGRDPS